VTRFRSRELGFGPALVAGGVALAVWCQSGEAEARAGGIAASSCEGCHGSDGNGKVTLSAEPVTITPGARIDLTLSILGGYANGGAYITTAEVGALQAVANQGLTLVTGGLVHNQPKPGNGSAVEFRFAWVAPATPGAVRFSVFALGGNANGRSSGDNGIYGDFDFVYGCTGQTFYLDGDGDGIGRADFSMLGCVGAPPTGFVGETGDCDDYRKTVYPGAQELCNMLDDNCDGAVDENAVPVELWPDADGDGYYDARTEKVGEPKVGCAGLKGWAAEPGDCKPQDEAVHAGAAEACNSVDDDCDGDIDERVRPTCGEGWCRREAAGCNPQNCTPGEPVKETCNFLDDDCDGLTDEDADVCPSGQTCAAGSCVDSSTVMLDPMPNPGSSGTSNPGSGTAGSSSIGGGQAAIDDGKESASGCALGARTGHGWLAIAAVLMAAAGLRRRRAG
jgi:Putative metal-binding motif